MVPMDVVVGILGGIAIAVACEALSKLAGLSPKGTVLVGVTAGFLVFFVGFGLVAWGAYHGE